MNTNEKLDLILENQEAIMEHLKPVALKTTDLLQQIVRTEKALAPQSDKIGYEGDIKEELKVGGTCPRCGTIGVCAEMLGFHLEKRCSQSCSTTKEEEK